MQSRIRHFVAEHADRAEAIVGRLHAKGPEGTRKLFELGAVYLNKRRLFADAGVIPGDYLRVHTEPRRYRRQTSLCSRVLHEDAHYVVLDKPGGLPCHATVDNGRENIIGWWEDETSEKLFITHRLDVPTSGCLVLARTPEAASRFNKHMLRGLVKKNYEALVEGDFQRDGEIVHWMEKGDWAPRVVHANPREETMECRLSILSREKTGDATRLHLELQTGRTHQIRAQMGALGHPVLNDEMYGGARLDPADRIALCARSITYSDPFTGAIRELTALSGPEEGLRIG